MRLFANLIITAAVCLGVISAATAYVVPLSLPDERLEGLELNAPAGVQRDEQGSDVLDDAGRPVPLVPAESDGEPTTLTPEVLGALRANGVERVRVKSFAFDRWSGRWWFLLAVVGLGAGAALIRVDARAQHAEEAGRDHDAEGSPSAALAAIRSRVDALRARTGGGHADDLHAIIEELGDLQQNEMARFAESRAALVARLGLAGYAAVMDAFATAERQINRAWSAAADGEADESLACLELAATRLTETAERLR